MAYSLFLLLLISTALHHLIFSFSHAYIKDDMCGDKNKTLQRAATLVAVFLCELRRTQTNGRCLHRSKTCCWCTHITK